MKQIKHILLFAAAFIVFLAACKKNNDNKNNSASIIGKWSKVNEIDWYSSLTGTSLEKDTTVAQPGEYADFRNDGKVYGYYWDFTGFERDTATYTVNGTTLYLDYGGGADGRDTFQIQTLTSNKLMLYQKYNDGTYIDEYWENFTK